MPGLLPNSPIKRLEHVIRQYDGTKNQRILPDVIVIALYALGRDRQARAIEGELYMTVSVMDHWKGHDTGNAYDHEYERRSLLLWLKQELPEQHQLDFIVPWVAKELGRLNREVRRGDAGGPRATDYSDAVDALIRKTPAIAMWSAQHRINLNRTSLAEALEAVRDFEVEVESDEIPQGEIVYEYADGWTMQRLGNNALEAEGELMQHCVGDYCEDVEQGKAVIFSLRDPKGRPHVTMEWEPFVDDDEEVLGALGHVARVGQRRVSETGRFAQIMGKQNEAPASRYRRRVQEFIVERFDGAPSALMQVYTEDLGILRFAGHVTRGVRFARSGAPELPTRLDFRGGEFYGCGWTDWPSGGNWERTTLYDCAFAVEQGAYAFAGASMHACVFRGRFVHCDFSNVTASSLRILVPLLAGRTVFLECVMHGMRITGTSRFTEVVFCSCDWRQSLWDGVMLQNTACVGGKYDGMQWRGVWLDDKTSVSPSRFENVDLRRASFDRESLVTAYWMARLPHSGGVLRENVLLPPPPSPYGP